MKTTDSKRIWILIVTLLGVQIGTLTILRGFTAVDVILPQKGLNSLPLEIGEWKGEDSELDAKVFPVLGTNHTVNRIYQGPKGRSLSLHTALWPDIKSLMPHQPQLCYTNAGWNLSEEKTVEVTTLTAPSIKVRLFSIERENRKMKVLYWYQLGDNIFWNNNDAKTAHRLLWGKQKVMAPMKVMIQIEDKNDDNAELLLREFAGHLYSWTRTLN